MNIQISTKNAGKLIKNDIRPLKVETSNVDFHEIGVCKIFRGLLYLF
ncbi:hypothetical protein bcgnr5372_20270 [Bacillus luti]